MNNVEDLKAFLKKNNLQPNFTYGQNFLIDDFILQDIVDASGVGEDDYVLEIGPGIGTLTELLLQKSKFVLAVEKDPKFLPILKRLKKQYKNFHYKIADALEYDFQGFFRNLQVDLEGQKTINSPSPSYDKEGKQQLQSALLSSSERRSGAVRRRGGMISENELLPERVSDERYRGGMIRGYKVVANIPYYITGKILQMLLTAHYKPTSITVLMQKEVAENIAASVGSLGILAISVQLYGDAKVIQTVPARSFYPAPKVDSAVVRIDVSPTPKYEVKNEKRFFRIIKACFAGKRKQIHNTLMNNLKLTKEEVNVLLKKLSISPLARPQELSIDQWIALAKEITNEETLG